MKPKKIVISFVFRRIKSPETEVEDRTEVILLTYEVSNVNIPGGVIAENIWEKLILENKKLMRECFIPDMYSRVRDKLKLELGEVTGDNKYDWRSIASLINSKIEETEVAYKTLFKITSKG